MSVPTHRVALVQFFADLVAEHHGDFDSILDLGCGELSTVWKQRWGKKYEGLDIRESVTPDYVGDACDLSRFKSNSRDVVCSWSTIEHVTHPYNLLTEAKRVSRGTVVLTTDYAEMDKNGDPTHLYAWTPKVLEQLVKRVHSDNTVYVTRGITVIVMRRCGDD